MYDNNGWNPVTGPQLDGFLSQDDVQEIGHPVNPGTVQVGWRSLPFYKQVALIRVKDPSWANKNLSCFFLTDKGKLFRLDGMSNPIHEVNREASIAISEDNVLEYLKFFCFFVRGDEGPFYIVEDMDDPNLPQDIDDKTANVLSGTARPATIEGIDENGNFICEAVVFYANALFNARFAVQPSGMIEMLQDEPIAADLPTRMDVPIK